MTQREILLERLKLYHKAEADILLHGQTAEVEGLRITRANIDVIRKEINNIKRALETLNKKAISKSRMRVIIPIE